MLNRRHGILAGIGRAIRARRIVAALCVLFLPFAATAQLDNGQFYVLDAFGGVHAGDGAPVISPATPYFGFDIAQDLTYVPVGSFFGHGHGILVLDALGGVHVGGALTIDPPALTTPYFGFDAARAIVYRSIPPRAAGASASNKATVTVSSFLAYAAAAIDVPDSGFLIASGSIQFECAVSTSGWAALNVGLALDGTTPVNIYTGVIPDCSSRDFETVAITHVFPVSGGGRRGVGLVIADGGGSVDPTVSSRDISVVFVEQNAGGGS